MYGAKVTAHHPDGGIEPLWECDNVKYEQLIRVSECYVSFLMLNNDGVIQDCGVIGQYNVFHPVEWLDIGL